MEKTNLSLVLCFEPNNLALNFLQEIEVKTKTLSKSVYNGYGEFEWKDEIIKYVELDGRKFKIKEFSKETVEKCGYEYEVQIPPDIAHWLKEENEKIKVKFYNVDYDDKKESQSIICSFLPHDICEFKFGNKKPVKNIILNKICYFLEKSDSKNYHYFCSVSANVLRWIAYNKHNLKK